MTKSKSTTGTGKRASRETPFRLKDILRKEEQPATGPIPPRVAKKLAQHRILLSSTNASFDPRKHWSKIEGSKGAWEFTTSEPVMHGLPVERMKRFEPKSLGRPLTAKTNLGPYRPPWQPFIYHPKRAFSKIAPRMMRRKNGTKVRPLTVFNHDDREIFFPIGYPWHCVGRISVMSASGDFFGTGTLIGKRTVLTAAHMVPWNDWEAGRAAILFQPGYYSPSVRLILGEPIIPIHSWATDAWGFVNAVKDARTGMDIATLRLADPLGEWLGYFGARLYDDDWEDDPRWTLIGYPGVVDVSPTIFPPGVTGTDIHHEFPTRQFGISVEDVDVDGVGLELETYGDATPGNSGGPLFGYWEKGPYIIGVLSSEELSGLFSGGTNIAAGGNAMMLLAHRAKNLWG